MNNYWSCSKFADWLRGTEKPGAATSNGWNAWRKLAKSTHPVRYWIAEEGLDRLQRFVYWIPERLNDVRYYINNRWITRTHALTSHPHDLPRGEWKDLGHRFLPCLFNELVEFVEVELAWHHVCWDDEARVKFKTPWWRTGWLRWRTWRCPEAGLAYLEWASELKVDHSNPGSYEYNKPTAQAMSAMEIRALYKWWTEVYHNRPDSMVASGLSAIYDRERKDDEDLFASLGRQRTAEEQEEWDKAHALSNQIDRDYELEDEEMMIRLIKIRDHLWT